MNNPKIRNAFVYVLIFLALAAILYSVRAQTPAKEVLSLGEIRDAIVRNEVEKIAVAEENLTVYFMPSSSHSIAVARVEGKSTAAEQLVSLGVPQESLARIKWDVQRPSDWGNIMALLSYSLPAVFVVGFIYFMMRQAQGTNNQAMQFGKSRARVFNSDQPAITFDDVAGVDESKAELQEVVEFLKEPEKFVGLGARIPKGVLLVGPPGTGKTLLAKACAGEAGVPFYSISGSDFVEMFVGVGAARVRDLFTQAKANAPAIIFVDEIDAVGRQRGTGMGGGHDEREQTLNQLLVEMDGFEANGQVILIAATNRPDVLDPALLRPGRFDRQIAVDRPDLKGREEILQVHAKGKPIAKDLTLLEYARRTPGFTGADLANVLNEAALLAARELKTEIGNRELDEAIDRVMAGPQRKSRLMSDSERLVTAYHEAGHALVAHALPHTDPVHKITIMPRGRALGYTMVLPDDDKYSTTRNQLLDQLAYSLGGRAAEELIFHDPTTGASNDIEKATALAKAMVTQYGMTEAIGAIKLGTDGSEPFMGRSYGHERDYSEKVASIIDAEVRKLIENAHQEAFDILVANRKTLDAMVLELLDRETINKDDIAIIFKRVKSWAERPAWTGSITRVPSDIPPVEVPARAKVAEVAEAKKPRTRKKSSE